MNKKELEQKTNNVFCNLPTEVQRYIDLLEQENLTNNDFIFALWELTTNQAETITAANLRELLRAKVVHDRNDIKSFKTKIK